MKILVIGAGALGGTLGGVLAEAGQEVTFLENDAARAELLNREGLILLEEGKAERRIALRVFSSLDGYGAAELVFVSVKSYQTEGAVRAALPAVGPNTRVLSMQNGVGNAEVMAGIIGAEKVLSGITYHSIQHLGPNRLRFRRGIKPIQIAPYRGKLTDEVRRIGEMFNRAGLQTEVSDSIEHVIWQKLLHNAVVNPVSALTGMSCDELLQDADLQALMRRMCEEIVAVMRGRGVPIQDEEDPYRPVVGSQKALGPNRPSMWQDLSRGLRTEIDALNGAVVREAEKLGLSVPVNQTIVWLVHSAERRAARKEGV